MTHFIYNWGWVILNSFIWGYAGYKFQSGRNQHRRWLRQASPQARMMYEGMQQMEKRVRRTAFRHPFWGQEKREAFIAQVARETVLMQLDYKPGDPCPVRCHRGYVDAYDPDKHMFPQRIPCPACKMIEEVYGAAPE